MEKSEIFHHIKQLSLKRKQLDTFPLRKQLKKVFQQTQIFLQH